MTVHPHGRGDNAQRVDVHQLFVGSPPRAWGQCSSTPLAASTARFTPTGVGTISASRTDATCPTVHPHGRGDNQFATPTGDAYCGSPPRAWGQLGRDQSGAFRWRFTPTGVGTISEAPRPAAGGAVHPHGRGDNLCKAAPATNKYGSPPRAWGQSSDPLHFDVIHRFTPTGVGTIW